MWFIRIQFNCNRRWTAFRSTDFSRYCGTLSPDCCNFIRCADISCYELGSRVLRSALNAEAILHAVERVDVHAAVGGRKPSPVTPRRNLIAARPQFLSGLGVER